MKIIKFIAIALVFFVIGFAVYTILNAGSMNKYNLPSEIYNNPKLREAYIYAIEAPEILEKFPCYCGCANIGHKNNKDCYFDAQGKLIEHASLCSGCVGVTLDIKKMIEEGRDIDSIKSYIDEKYAPKKNAR